MLALLRFLADPINLMILLGLFIGGYFLLEYLKQAGNSKNIKGKMKSVQNYRDGLARNNEAALEKKSSFERNKILNRYIERLDLSKSNPFVNVQNIRLLAARAGFSDIRTVKKTVFLICVLPFVMGPGAWFLLKFYLGMDLSFAKSVKIIAAGGAVGYYYPIMNLKSMADKRSKELAMYFPDMLDLLQVCIESGMSVEQSLIKITDEIAVSSPVTAEQLAITGTELGHLLEQKTAYNNLALRTGLTQYKSLASVLIQSALYGTPLVQGLRALSIEQREIQISEIERKAAALPAKLTIPVMLCIMPVLFIVIMAPAIINLKEIM
jgi:tight adherence protein C